jgi:hypothetical protein
MPTHRETPWLSDERAGVIRDSGSPVGRFGSGWRHHRARVVIRFIALVCIAHGGLMLLAEHA